MFYFLVCVFCLSYFLRQALLFSLGRPGIHDLAHAALSSWQLFCLSLLNPVIIQCNSYQLTFFTERERKKVLYTWSHFIR